MEKVQLADVKVERANMAEDFRAGYTVTVDGEEAGIIHKAPWDDGWSVRVWEADGTSRHLTQEDDKDGAVWAVLEHVAGY